MWHSAFESFFFLLCLSFLLPICTWLKSVSTQRCLWLSFTFSLSLSIGSYVFPCLFTCMVLVFSFFVFECLCVFFVYLTLPFASLCNIVTFSFSLFFDCWYIHAHELYQSSYMCELVMLFHMCLFRYMGFLLRWVFPCRCDLPLRCGELNCLVTTTCISL